MLLTIRQVAEVDSPAVAAVAEVVEEAAEEQDKLIKTLIFL